MSEMSPVGEEPLRRAQIESGRRFCGNDYEVVSSAPFTKSRHDMITSQLDIRTIRSQHMSSEERLQALINHVEAYSDFGMQCADYKAKTLMRY